MPLFVICTKRIRRKRLRGLSQGKQLLLQLRTSSVEMVNLPARNSFVLDLSGVHVINVLALCTGLKYVVDVSFGGDGPIKLVPLLEG